MTFLLWSIHGSSIISKSASLLRVRAYPVLNDAKTSRLGECRMMCRQRVFSGQELTVRPERKKLLNRSQSIVAAAMTLTLIACSDDNYSPEMPADGKMSIPAGRFAVAMNGGQNSGSVFIYSPDLSTMDRTLVTGANQGLAVGSDGTLYQNGDATGDAGIRALSRAANRADMDSLGTSDRVIGSAPGKGLFTLPAMGLLASCDVTDAQAGLKFYSSTAGEQARAVSSMTLPASCWDGFYAEAEDRLYLALINGSLAIIDDVSQLDLLATTGVTSYAEDVLDRMVTVVDADGRQQSINFHGVSAENGMVLVSDVGSADSPTDGALYVFSDDGTLDGEVALVPVSGPATMLGNPVDVLLVNGDAIVAEKSNNAILVFNDIPGRHGDVMPDYQLAFPQPESIAELVMDESILDAPDRVSSDTASRLLVSQTSGPQVAR